MTEAPVGLVHTVLGRVLPGAVALLAAASVVVSFCVSHTIHSEVMLRIRENAERSAELVAHRLDNQREYIKNLASNELLVNSLVDVPERERYLPLFFRSLSPPGALDARIALADYRGRPLISNGEVASREGAEWLPRVMDGEEHFSLTSDGLIVATAVRYAGHPEGMMVLEYGPESTKALLSVSNSNYQIAVLGQEGQLLSDLPDTVSPRVLVGTRKRNSAWVRYLVTVDRYPDLQVVILQPRAQAYARVWQLTSYLGLASVLSVVALVAGTVLTVRMTTAPLKTLLERIKGTQTASDLSATLDVRGALEFQQLAKSFNEMLDRLQQTTVSRDRLEGLNEELRDKSRELSTANQQLARSNDELKQFAYVASHDLQEPLRKVNSFCQLLRDEYSDGLDADAQTYIRYAVDGATRMRNLITDLLDYSRVETQGQPLELTNAGPACAEAISNLQAAIEETSAEIGVENLPEILADRAQLVRLFQNLIGNALKYRCGKTPEVHVGVDDCETEWVFFVQDNGIGIEPQYVERIFGMFQRLHPRDRYSGTGIGLAICKRIVDRLRGRIWVESSLGVGSTFFVSVPKCRLEATRSEFTYCAAGQAD